MTEADNMACLLKCDYFFEGTFLGKGLFGIKKTMGGTFSESKGHFITGNGSENQEEGPKNSHNHKKFT